MTDGLHGFHTRTREDSHEITYTPVGEPRTRLRFEPGETTRWVLYKDEWDSEAGEWRPLGEKPVHNLNVDAGGGR